MTVAGKIESTIAVPEGVHVSMKDSTIRVKGPKGELSRNFTHPTVSVVAEKDSVVVGCEYPNIREKAMVGTFCAHVRNMIRGVTEGYTYTLKIVFSHFPMKAAVKGNKIEISNYMGGHSLRYADIISGCKVKISGSDVTVEGCDIEAVGQTSANLERATSRRGFDKRVFQDGIYIVHKSHKVKE
ncbi:MAG: 50S ribosomal protein L6 [archaeon]|nr:50S ribosomal protein L6 [archaeon]